MNLFDTHTHLDDPVFDNDRIECAHSAYRHCVRRIMLVGYRAAYFERMALAAQQIKSAKRRVVAIPEVHLAYGLHPAYIAHHTQQDLSVLKGYLESADALGEIGLDRYTQELKEKQAFCKQLDFFRSQLDMAQDFDKPVLLHIRKAHGEALREIKDSGFDRGGIAHSFSGGEQEAIAFTELGFKLGVTTQITNPNAKKLIRAVQAVGIKHLVLETDSPDMLPFQLHEPGNLNRNEPKNLCRGLVALAQILGVELEELADVLWRNSLQALHISVQSDSDSSKFEQS